MRIGLIGLGRIGRFHATTLSSLESIESLHVADVDTGLAERTAEEVGARAEPSVAALLAADLDGVVIAASSHTHPDLIIAAAATGVPVFCEKPVAAAVDEGARVRDEVRGAVVQIGYPRRFDHGFVAARAAVQSGDLGWLHTVRSTTLDPAPPPAAYVATSGGIFRDCSVHDFDAVRWVTGQEVVDAYAAGSNQGDPVFAEHDDVDTAAAVLTLESGTLAVVSGARYNARGYDVRLEVHGSRDSVAAGLDDRLPIRSLEDAVDFPAGTPHTFFMDRFAQAFRSELTAFTEVVAGRRPSPCTIVDALEAGFVAEACARSLRERRPVALEEVRC